MENSGTYLLIAVGLAIYIYSKKNKVSSPKKATAKPRAAASSKPNAKKPATKKGSKAPQKGGVIGALPLPSPTKSKGNLLENTPNLSDFDLEKEVKQLQARTGWDYPTAKAYCQKTVEYYQKISSPTRLNKK